MTFKPKDSQERITHRLKIAQGHLKKVIEMVEDGDYCIDIIHQNQAVQKALKEIDSLTLENHLKCCVAHAIAQGNKDEAISEVISVLKKAS